MKLWTVHPYSVYETINTTGIYTCNPDLSSLLEENCFVKAYEWLSKEMKQQVGTPPNNVKFPVWAWQRYDGKNAKPDMRTTGIRVFEKSVLMEIEIPDNQVLLSDFDYWHIVLNNGLYYKANLVEGISDEEWFLETDKEDSYYESLSETEKVAYKENGWKKIFSSDVLKKSKFIQATFWELKKQYVKKVWHLKGFPKNKYML